MGWKLPALISILKLVVHPLIVLLLARYVFAVPPVWAGVAVLFASCPSGINAYLFAERYGEGVALASSSVCLSTILALGSTLVLALRARRRLAQGKSQTAFGLPPPTFRPHAGPGGSRRSGFLRAFRLASSSNQPMVVIDGARQSEQSLQQDVKVGRRLQILSAHHMGHPLQGVVDDHGQMIARGNFPPHDDASPQRARIGRLKVDAPIGIEAAIGQAFAENPGMQPCCRGAMYEGPRARSAGSPPRPEDAGRCRDRANAVRIPPLLRLASARGREAAKSLREQKHGRPGGGPARRRTPPGNRRNAPIAVRTGCSQRRPSQPRSSTIASTNSGRQRVTSISSMRSRRRPPSRSAHCALSSAE